VSEQQTIRWGILGTGNIAGQFARGLCDCPNAELVAVGSRSIDKARWFAEQFEIPHYHGAYEKLTQDPAVDVVYIATPHVLHGENMLMALEAGKAVLCEKPLALNESQAGRAVRLARRKRLFLMEAMWTKFLPPLVKLRQMLESGTIGAVRMVSADLGFAVPPNPRGRLFDLSLGGGCLLDVGIYPLWLATAILGPADQVSGEACIGPTGVDEQDAITLKYDDGRLACLYASIRTQTPAQACIIGSQGTIHLYRDWWKGGPMRVTAGGRRWEENVPVEGNGYQYEAEEVGRCLLSGQTQSQVMPPQESLAVLRTMDRLRGLWGLKYPMESSRMKSSHVGSSHTGSGWGAWAPREHSST
jgi:dihydrodiol dehydrogenase / D-xylose 1-dehydrogenase (NADP)